MRETHRHTHTHAHMLLETKPSVRQNPTGLLPLEKSNLLSPPTFSLQTLRSTESGKKAQDRLLFYFLNMSFCQLSSYGPSSGREET